MDIKLVIFPKDDMFHYSNYNEELQREFDAHLKHVSKEKCNLILEGIVAYRGEPMAFIDQQIEELCSVPKNLFNMLDNGSVVKSTCYFPKEINLFLLFHHFL